MWEKAYKSWQDDCFEELQKVPVFKGTRRRDVNFCEDGQVQVRGQFHLTDKLVTPWPESVHYREWVGEYTQEERGTSVMSATELAAAAPKRVQRNLDIAGTIIQQMGGRGQIMAMVGTKSFTAIESGLQFKFKGSKAANMVEIVLTPADLYTVTFYDVRKYAYAITDIFTDVYCDMLKDLFERTTGLYLSL